MIKRILLITLIVFCAFTATISAKNETVCDAEIGLLQTLNILDKNKELNLDEHITREDFAVYIAKANALSNSTKERYFIDVSLNSEAFGYMGELVAMGIVSQSDDDIFRAADYITFDEASKMIVSSLGYGKYAEASGGYPKGYMNIASSYNIRLGSGRLYMTYADAVKSIYDTLKCYAGSVSGANAVGIEYSQGDKTLCEIKFGLSFDKGTLVANEYGNIESPDYLGKNRARINDKEYYVKEEFDSQKLLGCYVTYFYNEDNDEIVYMCIEKQKQKDTIISIDDIVNISGGIVYYENNGKSKYVKSNTNNIVYNGFYLGSDVENTLSNLNKGYVIMRDSDNDAKYDCILIFDYQNFYVANISDDNLKLYNKLSSNNNLDLNDVSSLSITKNNIRVDVKDIQVNDSLTLLKAKNNEVIQIIINTDVINGKLTGYNDEEAFVDGEKYGIDNTYLSEFNKMSKTGSVARFSLDMFGKIVYVETAENTWNFGYIIKIVNDEDLDEFFIRIITENGDKKIFNFANSVKIDESPFKTNKSIENSLLALDDNLIRYKINAEGKINTIDTVRLGENENIEYSLIPVYDEDKNWSTMVNINKYGNKAIFKEDTLGFTIPSDESDMYSVNKGYPRMLSTGNNSGSYGVMRCYFADTATSDGYCDVYVRTFDYSISNSVTIMMYDKISECINDEDEIVYSIQGYSGGVYKQVEVSKEIDAESLAELMSCKKGDIVRLTICNDDLSKSSVQRVYDARNDKVMHFSGITAEHTWYSGTSEEGFYTSSANLSYGQIYDRFGNVFSIRNDENSLVNERFKISDSMICVFYDVDKNEIYTGNYQNILTYDDVSDSCMKTIKQCRWGTTTAVYLYQ